jgi:hypothetical protein
VCRHLIKEAAAISHEKSKECCGFCFWFKTMTTHQRNPDFPVGDKTPALRFRTNFENRLVDFECVKNEVIIISFDLNQFFPFSRDLLVLNETGAFASMAQLLMDSQPQDIYCL